MIRVEKNGAQEKYYGYIFGAQLVNWRTKVVYEVAGKFHAIIVVEVRFPRTLLSRNDRYL